MKQLLVVLIFSSLLFACAGEMNNQNKKLPSGDYPGESIPDSQPKLFSPNFISTHLHERDVAMTPDGKEIYFSVMGRDYCVIAFTKLENGKWTEPKIAPFSGSKDYMDIEPFISSDGKQFFFMSTRPDKGQEPKPGWFYQNIWVMDRTETGWSEPYKLPAPISSDAGEYYPTLTNDGTIYFTREDGENKQSIYRSRKVDGKYQEPERLPNEVNASDRQYNAMIAPDESYLIVCSQLKENAIGRTDYCISFRTEDDRWTPLINMGETVNFEGCTASAPALSPDGKYFFFSSNKRKDAYEQNPKHTLTALQESALSPQNGSLDIYWVESKFIDELRKRYFAENK